MVGPQQKANVISRVAQPALQKRILRRWRTRILKIAIAAVAMGGCYLATAFFSSA